MPPALARAARLLRRSRWRRPSVSILVDLRGATGPSADRTLHAARAQPGPDVEILPLGAPELPELRAVLDQHAAEDWRVRRTGTPRGSHVLCVSAGDELIADAVPALRGRAADGVDAVVGAAEGARPAGVALPVDRSAAPPPLELVPALLGRVLWRREVWNRLPQDDATVTYLAGLRDADEIRSTTKPVVRRAEPDPGVFGAMPDPTPELGGWLERQVRVEEGLGRGDPREDGRDHRADWAVGVALEAERFLDATERMDDQQWAAFQQRIRRVVDLAGDALIRVPVETRVKTWLAGHDRRDALEAFVRGRRLEDGQLPTTVTAGAVHAVLPGLPLDVPDWCLELTEDETPLRASLVGVRQVGDLLELRLLALLDRVGLGDFPHTRVRLVGDGDARDLEVRPEADPAATRFGGSRYHDQDRAVVRCRVPIADLAAAPGGEAEWRLEVTCDVDGVRRTGLVAHHDPGAAIDQFEGRSGDRTVRVATAREAPVRLLVGRAQHTGAEQVGPVLTAVTIEDDVLTLEGTWPPSAPGERDGPEVVLQHPRLQLVPTGSTTVRGGSATRREFTTSIPLRADEWGLGERPAPSGRYRLELAGAQTVQLGEDLRARMPVTWLGSHRAQLRTTRNGRLELVLGPPLTDDELGPYRQQRLQRWYAGTAPRKVPVVKRRVYFQSYDGRSATDSPLAIFEELRGRPGAESLDLVWAVADEHAWTPEGARRVLWRSREWYAALATSAYVVTSIELERWFRARPGQWVLQSFHGYPSKTMGIGLWRAKNFTESRIEQQLDRTSRNWDLLLTPAPEMDRHYREQYRYDGEILAAGYPRDDALLATDADAVRSATRERLGITEGQTVVLYAPTWRDDLAVNFRSARMGDHLDLPALADALGPEYVVLVRGHRFHARGETARAGRSSRLVDVTDYPEVNHLILAADAAVLDYSSMRFDIALTGKPMVFLVPDLDDYTGGVRGFLYDFRDTAPGPLAQDQAEVVAALRDLHGVRARYESAYRKFNETYNYRNDGHAAARVVDVFFRDLL